LLTMENLNASLPNKTMTYEELLDSLGFDLVKTILTTFLLPIISILGTILCLLSFWIFSQRRFVDPIFYFYKLLCIVYVIHLVHNIPYGIIFAPRYFPYMNTYLSSLFQIYCNVMTNFLYHYEDTLQMGILMFRIKIFSPFVSRYFSASPQRISLAFLFICILIDMPIAFSFKITPFGLYSYTDSNGNLHGNNTFYYFTSSEFSTSLMGQIFFGVTSFFLNLFLTLVIGVTLNVTSYYQYKSFLVHSKRMFEEYWISLVTPSDLLLEVLPRPMSQKKINDRNAERNMFRMAIIQCTISIFMRSIFMFTYVYFTFFYSFSHSLYLLIVNNFLCALEGSLSIFIFYSFNKMFRHELKRHFSQNGIRTSSDQLRNELED
jgi:hypothetical protein